MGIIDYGSGVGTEKILPVTDADGHRAALLGCDDLVCVAFLYDCDRISSDNLFEGLADCVCERAVALLPDVFDKVDDDLRVGAAAESEAVLLESLLEDAVVLDDAVMDQGDIP